jgi:restriction endonuclease S subunit
MPSRALFDLAEVFLGTPTVRAGAKGRSARAVRLADLAAGLPAELGLRGAELDPRRATSDRALRAGDVLVTARGTKLHAAVVPKAHAGAYATENLIVVRPNESGDLLPEYLALLLEHGGEAEKLASRLSSLYLLSPRKLERWRVPLLPIETQRDLAAVLSTTRRAIRAADEANRARRELLRAVASDVLLREGEGEEE